MLPYSLVKNMKIIVDADACPVTDTVVCVAKKKNLQCILVCDNTHLQKSEYAQVLTVDKGADCADIKIANIVSAGDTVVTQDYGLAALCLGKRAKILTQNGLIITDENIESLLYSRFMSKKARMSGKRTKGSKKRTSDDDKSFTEALYFVLEENQ